MTSDVVSRRARSLTCCACMSGLLLLGRSPSSARAAEATDATDTNPAERLYKEGKALLLNREYEKACEKLAESKRLAADGKVTLALAACREGEGKLAAAHQAYRESLDFARRDGRKDRADYATAKLAELEPKLARLRLVLSPEAARQGVSVFLDDAAVDAAAIGVAFAVDAGPHRLSTRAPGHEDRTETIGAENGQTKEISVGSLSPLPKPPVGPAIAPASGLGSVATPSGTTVASSGAPRDDGPGEGRLGATRITGLVVGGVGLASVLVGGYFGYRALSLGRDVAARCPTSSCDDPIGLQENADAHRSARVANWTVIAGLAGVGVGAGLYLLGGRASGPRVAIAPGVAFVSWSASW